MVGVLHALRAAILCEDTVDLDTLAVEECHQEAAFDDEADPSFPDRL